jgi:hypothetical protein
LITCKVCNAHFDSPDAIGLDLSGKTAEVDQKQRATFRHVEITLSEALAAWMLMHIEMHGGDPDKVRFEMPIDGTMVKAST